VEKRYCYRCRKCMTDEVTGTTIVGVSLRSTTFWGCGNEFLQKQFGPYELGLTYEFCWECTIRNLMGGEDDR